MMQGIDWGDNAKPQTQQAVGLMADYSMKIQQLRQKAASEANQQAGQQYQSIMEHQDRQGQLANQAQSIQQEGQFQQGQLANTAAEVQGKNQYLGQMASQGQQRLNLDGTVNLTELAIKQQKAQEESAQFGVEQQARQLNMQDIMDARQAAATGGLQGWQQAMMKIGKFDDVIKMDGALEDYNQKVTKGKRDNIAMMVDATKADDVIDATRNIKMSRQIGDLTAAAGQMPEGEAKQNILKQVSQIYRDNGYHSTADAYDQLDSNGQIRMGMTTGLADSKALGTSLQNVGMQGVVMNKLNQGQQGLQAQQNDPINNQRFFTTLSDKGKQAWNMAAQTGQDPREAALNAEGRMFNQGLQSTGQQEADKGVLKDLSDQSNKLQQQQNVLEQMNVAAQKANPGPGDKIVGPLGEQLNQMGFTNAWGANKEIYEQQKAQYQILVGKTAGRGVGAVIERLDKAQNGLTKEGVQATAELGRINTALVQAQTDFTRHYEMKNGTTAGAETAFPQFINQIADPKTGKLDMNALHNKDYLDDKYMTPQDKPTSKQKEEQQQEPSYTRDQLLDAAARYDAKNMPESARAVRQHMIDKGM